MHVWVKTCSNLPTYLTRECGQESCGSELHTTSAMQLIGMPCLTLTVDIMTRLMLVIFLLLEVKGKLKYKYMCAIFSEIGHNMYVC